MIMKLKNVNFAIQNIINNVDINKMLIGNSFSFGKNLLNTLLDARLVTKLSRILLPSMS